MDIINVKKSVTIHINVNQTVDFANKYSSQMILIFFKGDIMMTIVMCIENIPMNVS